MSQKDRNPDNDSSKFKHCKFPKNSLPRRYDPNKTAQSSIQRLARMGEDEKYGKHVQNEHSERSW